MTRNANRLITMTAALALLAPACGDDGGMSSMNTPDAMPMTGGPDAGGGAAACPDHPNVTEMSGVCAITGGENAPVTDDLTLTADVEWLLNGPVFIGDDTDETILTIEPGTTVYGGTGSFLLIQRGSKIMAEGTADAPIVFTSAKPEGQRGPEDWGGLVLNGRAPINNGDASGEAPGEAGTGTYGGDQPEDSSGVLTYVRVEFSGNKVDAENELNGIGFQGVGSGTTIDYVQAHMTSDDGVEFFGGTVDVRHLVLTGADDDSLDWTGGWTGTAQFVVAEQLPASGTEAERGIEADNLEANHMAEPYSSPVLSNLTLMARSGNTSEGVRFRRGTRAKLYNSIVTGFDGICINVTDDQTLANIDDGSLAVDNVILNCGGGAINAEASGLETDATVVTDDAMLTGWMPEAGSPALGMGTTAATGASFESVDYAGAFDGDTDWTEGWINLSEN
jgi:hypothetical protein